MYNFEHISPASWVLAQKIVLEPPLAYTVDRIAQAAACNGRLALWLTNGTLSVAIYERNTTTQWDWTTSLVDISGSGNFGLNGVTHLAISPNWLAVADREYPPPDENIVGWIRVFRRLSYGQWALWQTLSEADFTPRNELSTAQDFPWAFAIDASIPDSPQIVASTTV